MLQNIREKFTGWIALAILGLIGLSFVFVGGANFAFIGNNYAAKVNGVEIGVNYFENQYRSQVELNPQITQLPPEFRQQVRMNILENLIQQSLVDQYIAKQGLQISDRAVTDWIQRVPDFQVDGKFDRETYQNVLTLNGLDPKVWEEQQRQALRREQLQRAIGGTSVVTPGEYRRYLNLAAEQRVVRLANLDGAAIAEGVEVTDEKVQAYYDENPLMFQLPESVDLQFIEIRRDALAAAVEIADDELTEYYETEKDRFLMDEQRQARHILILFDDDEDGARATAQDLYTRVDGGESFEDLASEFSKDGLTAANGGDLGALTKTQLPDALGDAIFEMVEGEVRGPVRSDFGFHVVRLESILEQGPQAIEMVRGELLAELRDIRAESRFDALERQVSDALFDAEDMDAIAAASGLEIQTVAGFTLNGGEPFGANQAVIDAVFDDAAKTEGRITDIVEIDANRSAIFRVTAYQEAARQPLADVRGEIVASLRASESDKIMIAKADDMLLKLAEGTEFPAAAEAIGAAAEEPRLIARGAQDVDQSVVFAVFSAGKPTQDDAVTGQVQNTEGGYTIYEVEAVLPGRPESIPLADRDAGKERLAQDSGMADYVAFVMALRESADVSINQDVVAAQDLL
ncbi:MAG: SurA N-terminal domain-containing protein [Woeseiaceae bacterium]|nr:SurA N-terminal domain-containing protein [Woeseiaceae bacterium]